MGRILRRLTRAAALALGACVASQPAPSRLPPARLYNPNADARKDIAAALALAYTKHTLVVLEFGANWCPACHFLAGLFADPIVQPFFDSHFEHVRINVGDFDRNQDIIRKYAIQGGIPAAVVLDSIGEVIAVMQNRGLTSDGTARTALNELERWVAAKP